MIEGTKRSTSLAASLLLTAGLVGCGLEGGPVGGPGGGDGDGDVPSRIPSPEPGQDDRLDALGIVCESTLTLSGTFTPSGTPPEGEEDCWPEGVWRITPSIDFQGCDPQEAVDIEHVYTVTYDEENALLNIVYENDPTDDRVNLKFTFDSSGLCLGGFEHFREDFVLTELKPVAGLDGVMTGSGRFAVFEEDPF